MDLDWELSGAQLAWGLLGVAVLLVLVAAAFGMIGTLAFGVFLYYATRPAYDWFDERLDHPDLSATLTLSLVGVPLLVIFAYAGYVGVQEFAAVVRTTDLSQSIPFLQSYLDVQGASNLSSLGRTLLRNPGQLAGMSLPSIVQRYVGSAITYLGEVMSVLVRVFILVTVAFYLLRDDYKISQWLRRSFDHDPTFVEFTNRVDDDLQTVYFGNLATIAISALIAVAVFYGLNLLLPSQQGISRPILLGFVTGVSVLVPALGMKAVYVPYAGILLFRAFTGGLPLWFPVAFLVATFIIVDTVPDFFIRSYLSKGSLNMGLVLLAYVIGVVAYGWRGVFIAPIVLVVGYRFAIDVFPNLVSGRPVS